MQSAPILSFGFASNGSVAISRQDGDRIALGADFPQRTLNCGSGLAWTPLVEGQRSHRPVELLQSGSDEGDVGGFRVTARPGPPGSKLIGDSAIAPDGSKFAILMGVVDESGAAIKNIRLTFCDTNTGQRLREVTAPVVVASTLGPVLFDERSNRTIFGVTVPQGRRPAQAALTSSSPTALPARPNCSCIGRSVSSFRWRSHPATRALLWRTKKGRSPSRVQHKVL